MQIVIDIPEKTYSYARHYRYTEDDMHIAMNSIKHGTPLPPHGRLIDAEVFASNVVKYSHQSTKTIGQALADTPTIIEADTEPMYYPQVDGITPTVVAESEDKE